MTPTQIRRSGRRRLTEYLRHVGGLHGAYIDALVEQALAAAQRQRITVPGETIAAEPVRDLASEALTSRTKLADVDKRIAEVLDAHPDAALIRSLPRMGAALTAEFLAAAGGIARFATGDHLACAAGLAPVLQQSGKMRYLRRATSGDKTLKRIFYQSAFCALQHDPTSRAYYDRNRAEGKRHQQALIALARRRINVLHAILRNRKPCLPDHALAA